MAIKTITAKMGVIKGLNQTIDENLMSLSYSPDCQNIDVSEGILSTRGGSIEAAPTNAAFGYAKPASLHVFNHRTYGMILIVGFIGTTMETGDYTEWYAYHKNASFGTTYSWHRIYLADGTTAALTALWPNATPKPKSVIMDISDVQYMIIDNYKLWVYKDGSNNLFVRAAALGGTPTGKNFNTVHKDRLWKTIFGTNTVYYSNAYAPEDWTTAGAAGNIIIQTDDGDSIVGMANIFDDVVIFKQNSIKKIAGDTPSEYSVETVYASKGAIYYDSICTDGTNCFFAGADGIYRYTGTEVLPLLTDEIKDIYPNMKDVRCELSDNILYVFSRVPFSGPNPVLTGYVGKYIKYDLRKKTIEVHVETSPYIYDSCTSGETIYRLAYDRVFKYSSALEPLSCYWLTPRTDFGYPNADKTLTDLYFTGWGTKSDGTPGGQVKITVYYNKNGVEKTKEKTVTLQTTRKLHNLQFSVTGRIFAFKFENVSGSAINLSGIDFKFELDED